MNNLLTARAVLVLNGKDRVGYTVSGEDMPMLTAEVKGIISEFLNSYHHKGVSINRAKLVTYITRDNTEKITPYVVSEEEAAYVLIRQDGKKNVFKKEEKKMKTEQIEFDLTVGMEQTAVAAEKVPAGMKLENDAQIDAVMTKLDKVMKEKGIDPSDKKAAAAFILANKELVSAINQEVAAPAPIAPKAELAGPMHDAFMEALKKFNMYSDNHVVAALTSFAFKGKEESAFVDAVYTEFKESERKIAQYFRDMAGIKDANKHIVKTAAYVTGDTFRTTGNLIEAGVTKTVQALNKYVFHMAARIVEAPAGGRPEEIKDYNYVNDAAGRAWDKIKPEKKK